jgi:hypothetical protein
MMIGRVICSVAAIVFFAIGGCGRGKTADDRINAELARTGGSREAVFPFSGKVTVDGTVYALAKKNRRLVVALFLAAPSEQSTAAAAFAECNSDGSFAFETIREGDGVAPGDYIITFADLTYRRKGGYRGPDGLKNLYNDPSQNAKHPEFRIDHHAPGRTDYEFDLRVAGEERIVQPGQRPLTSVNP